MRAPRRDSVLVFVADIFFAYAAARRAAAATVPRFARDNAARRCYNAAVGVLANVWRMTRAARAATRDGLDKTMVSAHSDARPPFVACA